MSADPIADALLQVYTTDLGYHAVLKTMPAVKEYDTLPIVEIAYKRRPKINKPAFGYVNVSQDYQIVYIVDNSLSNVPSDDITNFKNNTINSFMAYNNRLLAVSAVNYWRSRVYDDYDYKREDAREGYIYSSMIVNVDWIIASG